MESTTGQPSGRVKRGKLKMSKRMVAVLLSVAIVLLVAVASGWFLYRSSTASTIDTNKYQAVFFTNGQVYFGKLAQVNANYFRLTDVFYIQAGDSETQSQSENPQETASDQNNIQLIKLGNEVHGPDDEMIISKDQVLFFENLKGDGKVSSSIEAYNKQQEKVSQ